MSNRTAKEILADTRGLLETASFGNELLALPERRMAGLRNVIVFGRAVTNALQNLRSVVPRFDDWYQHKVEEMAADPLMVRFYKLRTDILKKGVLAVASYTDIKNFSSTDLQKLPRPPGAVAFFIGDENGGDGWIVKLPDGTEGKFYIDLPPHIATSGLAFRDYANSSFRDSQRNDVRQMCEKYLSYLHGLLAEAEAKFSES